MTTPEIQAAKALIIVEIIEYIPNSIVSRTILKKTTGNVSLISLDTGEALSEKISPFDTFIQIIDGRAEITIDGVNHSLETGQGIIIPAHKTQIVSANERFKMISTVIKSGYES
jgi:quercetin dioxygenase-like cupin family protein